MANNSKGEYRDFVSRCLVPGCDNKELIEWKHATCGTQTQFNQQGELYCRTCESKSFILDNIFSCGKVKDCYRVASNGEEKILALLDLRMQAGEHDRAWYQVLTDNLTRRLLNR